jgi:hypothetical protein
MLSDVRSIAKKLGHDATYVIYSRLLPSRSFGFNGSRHRYFYHRYNSTCETERCVEIPIALDFLRSRPAGAILEIGNVLNHYTPFQHTVVDKYELGAGVTNADVCDFEPMHNYDAIVSISTIEHVGWDEERFDSRKAIRAIERLRQMLLPTGGMLISFPIGHNASIDQAMQDGTLDCADLRCMKRISGSDWVEVSVRQLAGCRLNPPYRRGGGAYRRVKAVAFAYFGSKESCKSVDRNCA